MTYLDELVAGRRMSLQRHRDSAEIGAVRAAATARTDHRGFAAALKRPAGAGVHIIAEFKRASPSAGAIVHDADPFAYAAAVSRGGAAAISVLTEPDRFLGSLQDLIEARAACTLPVLCKDFIVDQDQLWSAAAAGADAVLLIARVLDDGAMEALLALALSLGLDALVEVHDVDDVRRAIDAGAIMMGVNNRDLSTFAVDPDRSLRMRASIPAGIVAIAESGYRTRDQLCACDAAGFDAVLVGESLMRAHDPTAAVKFLRGDLA